MRQCFDPHTGQLKARYRRDMASWPSLGHRCVGHSAWDTCFVTGFAQGGAISNSLSSLGHRCREDGTVVLAAVDIPKLTLIWMSTSVRMVLAAAAPPPAAAAGARC
jgi:hypothetical protein